MRRYIPPKQRTLSESNVTNQWLNSVLVNRDKQLYLKNAVFLDVAPYRSCVNRRFEETYRLHLQGRKIRESGTSVSRWLQTGGSELRTSNYSVIVNLHTLRITTASIKPFPAFSWQRFLTVETLQLPDLRSSCHSCPCNCQLNHSAISSDPPA
jgi:hypothetical protein